MTQNKFFKSKISKQQFNLRSAAFLQALKEFRTTAILNRDTLVQHQENQLKRLLSYAFTSIPFYTALYQEAGFHPDQFQTIDDLQKIPITTKTMLRSAHQTNLQPPTLKNTLYLSTSGSTGEPVGLYKSETSMWMFMAAAFYQYQKWCGESPLRNVLYILDETPSNIDYILGDLLRTFAMENRFVSAFSTVDTIANAVDLFQPEYISTYPSVARNLALYARDQSWTIPQLKILNLTSEMLDTHTKNLIQETCPNVHIIETYTSTEAGFMGYQCLDKGGFHLSENLGIYEHLPVKNHPGLSELIATDLSNFATPLIRYSGLNDIVSIATQPCTCGSLYTRIENLHGRVVDSVVLPNGTQVSPYILTNIVSKIHGIKKYQIIQTEPTFFHIKIVLNDSTNQDTSTLENELNTAFQKALHSSVQCQVDAIDDILPKPGQHKIPLVQSKLQEP